MAIDKILIWAQGVAQQVIREETKKAYSNPETRIPKSETPLPAYERGSAHIAELLYDAKKNLESTIGAVEQSARRNLFQLFPNQNPFIGTVEDGALRVEMRKNPRSGALEFTAIDNASGKITSRGYLYMGADGRSIFVGNYDKPLRNFFKLNGITEPTAFVLPKSTSLALPMPDDVVISSLQKFFYEKFVLKQEYTKVKVYVSTPTEAQSYQQAIERFFGANIKGSQRWLTLPLQKALVEYEPLGKNAIALDSTYHHGGTLFPDGRMDLNGEIEFPNLATETAYSQLNPLKNLPEGTRFSIETPGLSAPGSAQARPTHKIFNFYDPVEGKTVAVSMDLARSVYTNVNIFAFSHHHADHVNPRLLLKQLIYNSGDGRETTLLMDNKVAETILEDLAKEGGWNPDSTLHRMDPEYPKTPLEFLNHETKGLGLKVKVQDKLDFGDLTLQMVIGYEGAHGPAQAGVAVIQKGRTLYFDPSDGDFDIASIDKQIRDWETIEQRMYELRSKGVRDPESKEAKELKSLEDDLPRKKEMLQGLERTRRYLREAELIDVDQGTTGADTHGTDKTVRNLREARLEKPQYPHLTEDQKKSILDWADRGQWDEIKSYLIDENWPGEKVRAAVEMELQGVRPTHNLGYQNRFAIPQVREGRVLEIRADGSNRIRYPKLESELTREGLALIPEEHINSRPMGSFVEIEFEGARYFLEKVGAHDGIKRIVERHSAIDVLNTPQGKVEKPYFDLQSMSLIDPETKQAVSVTEIEDLQLKAQKAPAPTGKNAFQFFDDQALKTTSTASAPPALPPQTPQEGNQGAQNQTQVPQPSQSTPFENAGDRALAVNPDAQAIDIDLNAPVQAAGIPQAQATPPLQAPVSQSQKIEGLMEIYFDQDGTKITRTSEGTKVYDKDNHLIHEGPFEEYDYLTGASQVLHGSSGRGVKFFFGQEISKAYSQELLTNAALLMVGMGLTYGIEETFHVNLGPEGRLVTSMAPMSYSLAKGASASVENLIQQGMSVGFARAITAAKIAKDFGIGLLAGWTATHFMSAIGADATTSEAFGMISGFLATTAPTALGAAGAAAAVAAASVAAAFLAGGAIGLAADKLSGGKLSDLMADGLETEINAVTSEKGERIVKTFLPAAGPTAFAMPLIDTLYRSHHYAMERKRINAEMQAEEAQKKYEEKQGLSREFREARESLALLANKEGRVYDRARVVEGQIEQYFATTLTDPALRDQYGDIKVDAREGFLKSLEAPGITWKPTNDWEAYQIIVEDPQSHTQVVLTWNPKIGAAKLEEVILCQNQEPSLEERYGYDYYAVNLPRFQSAGGVKGIETDPLPFLPLKTSR